MSANLVILLLHLVTGARSVPPLEAIRTVLSGSGEYAFTVMDLRLPRAMTGFLVGCGLALSGTILQVITRNPLASPGVIGLNSGAAAAVVAVMILVPTFPMSRLPFIAFGGAAAAAALIYILSWKKGTSTTRMLLIGIGITAMAGSLITYWLTVGGIFRVTQASIWMAGSLYGRTWEHFWPLLPWLVILFPLLLLLARTLDIFQLADESALGLGVRLELMRGLFLLLAVAFAGSSVAMAGTIAFVGLMAPHMAHYLVGSRSHRRLPIAALLGGLLVMLADLAGRLIFSPHEIPAGLMTVLFGAPYMFYLLLRSRTL
ncbi:FecCD family ABC transporter permease [Paenibacillus herberti]|uniref:Iron ABC transporter permease n=1 Tax=Paenibacillus herberti TaxID=1619309 RepID=A0A229NY21_9BACL|nr:iron ABC transporter permease [Paenibacillus herberti]OXM14651.1 iron ABC transporter permease [Paenibacillus herberti]